VYRFRAATAYTYGDNDLVVKKMKVISGACFRRSSYTRSDRPTLDNRNRMGLALLLSKFLFLLFQVH
jgi:hypothetical protein